MMPPEKQQTIAKNIREVERYLTSRFSAMEISQASQCALVDDQVVYGYLIRLREGDMEYTVVPLMEFLSSMPSQQVFNLLEKMGLSEFLKQSRGHLVQVTSRGCKLWNPVRARTVA